MAILSGLYVGIREGNLVLEIQALATGVTLFFMANWLIGKIRK